MSRLASTPKATASKKRPASKTTLVPESLEAPHSYVGGDLVSHPMFGDGTVMAIDDDKLTIDFVDRGVKQIVHDYVKRRTQ